MDGKYLETHDSLRAGDMRLGNGVKIERVSKGNTRTLLSASKANDLIDAINALLNPTIGIGAVNSVTISEGGWNIQLKQLASGGSTSTTTGAFKVKQEFGDYLQCTAWDGTSEAPTYSYVAKPTLLRRSLAGRTEDGVTVTFAYALVTSIWNRTQHVTSPASYDDEVHVAKPAYVASGINGDGTPIAGGDVIWAIGVASAFIVTNPADTGTPGVATAITWLDLNIDGRKWWQVAVLPAP